MVTATATRLLAVLSLALVFPSGLSGQASPTSCGVERWPVKIAVDADAGRIDTVPVRSSVSELRALSRPSTTLPYRNRLGPHELTTFRVVALLQEVLSENDGDLHLVLADLENLTNTMVAEIPDSSCAIGSPYAGAFATARRSLQAAPQNAIVVIEGVGFFDHLHGQRGMAPNGFELHPVLTVRVVGQLIVAPKLDSSVTTFRDADRVAGPLTKVWVNTSTMVYHCPGTRWYGATKRGTYMTEAAAMAAGAHAAYGRRCGIP